MKRLGILVLVVVVSAVAFGAWSILGPGPLGFAAGKTVPLTSGQAQGLSGVPVSLASAALRVRGEYLARAADCESCHTAKGGRAFAGGVAFNLPFGTLYSPNITPDRRTGIGAWSDAQFLNALQQGVAPDGSHYYPAFPFAAYSLMTEADALAIKAYLMSVPPVQAATPPNTLRFPFNQRALLRLWSVLFNPGRRFERDPGRTPQWNRGAYLAEALGHCGDCHTPRNLLEGLDNRRKFAGAVASGWKAFNITPDRRTGIGEWDDEALVRYLSVGHAAGHGTASGPMGEAVDHSLSHLTPGDIAALVAYMRSVPARFDASMRAPQARAAREAGALASRQGELIYAGACASCHGLDGQSPVMAFATLAGSRALHDPSARNVVQAVVWGVRRQTADIDAEMPAFGSGYSNVEIAAVANYVTARLGATPSAVTATDVARMRSEGSQ